ncbi:nicotinamide N-methyltransferase [Fusarium albosuccineum]|uniref:Nicotinamide N-methyltransferase n=1 Tax=Fusarium albosuccineum TaxID=1237068 RepID=A0A8H4L886_9HYPO|nr:nicotinamide N-methyltransferase [Fusarium albosuccineum]
MSLINKRHKALLYAQNSPKDSVGPRLGTLPAGLLGRVQCWEAVGDARREFTEQLKDDIVKFLEQDNDTVQDPGNIIYLSLFMLGRSTTQAKPTVMFVSENKKARKEAFNMVKSSKIIEMYPGFELGHIPLTAEFENLKFLAGEESLRKRDTSSIDDSPDVFWLQSNRLEGRRLYFYTKTSSEENPRTATAGGVITYRGRPMLLTVNHFLEPTPTIATPFFASTSEGGEDSDDECEITGLSDFDEEDEDRFIEITSQGSITPEFETSDVDGSRSDNYEGSILSSGSTIDLHNTTALQERLGRLQQNQTGIPLNGSSKQQCTRVGKVILRSKDLDYSLVEINHPLASIEGLENSTIELSDVSRIEPGCRDAAVRATTPDGGILGGALSGTPSYVRLPQSRMYVEVYLARFNRPLVPGDCGSWVRDAVTGRLFGHVFAGSPTSGLTMIMPACHVFENARYFLESQSRDIETKGIREGAGKVEQERYQTQDTERQSPNSQLIAFEETTRLVHELETCMGEYRRKHTENLATVRKILSAPPLHIEEPLFDFARSWKATAGLSRELSYFHTRPDSSDRASRHHL